MSREGDAPLSILLVEDWAHKSEGHFPTRFAELANAHVQDGCQVQVLTSQGWLFDDPEKADTFEVIRYSTFPLILDRLAQVLQKHRIHSVLGRVATNLSGVFRAVAIVSATRNLRRTSKRTPDYTVVLSFGNRILLTAAIAGPGHWLLYAFTPPSPEKRTREHFIRRMAKRAELRRRKNGGGVRVGTSYETSRREWANIAPFLDPVVIPIAGCRRRGPTVEARRQLGIAADEKIALIFGSSIGKDVDTAGLAFSQFDEWRLLVVGNVVDAFNDAQHPTFHRMPMLIGGFASDELRDLAYSAADLVVLSFGADYQANSGTLMDAVSFGVPVVCSQSSSAAEIVIRHRLGVTFAVGDSDSLMHAIRTVPSALDPSDLEGAQDALSSRAVARRHRQVLEDFHSPHTSVGH